MVAALLMLGTASGAMAQKKDFNYKFYGQIRTDLFYNSRDNVESVDGLFYMFPKDHDYDPNGKDRNGFDSSNFYTLYTRLGVDVQGPMLFGRIKTSAKVEADFRGSGSGFSTVRLRQAYMNFDWGGSALALGQTWHPLYGAVAPDIMNLNMGAPYQPFSRAPQIRYQFTGKHFVLTASAIWQSQYLSMGPSTNKEGEMKGKKSQAFIKNSCVPEFYFGVDYKDNGLLAGAGVHVSSITPRVVSEYNGNTYSVNERVTGVSGEAHLKYKSNKFLFAAKTLLSTNLTQTSTVGGYGVTTVNSKNGEQKYAPLRTSHSWVNMVYGKTWKVGIFGGYLKNLGASKEVSNIISSAANVDQIGSASAELTYNLPHWKFGAEYMWSGACYGKYGKKGKVTDTHLVKNNRVVLSALFLF